MNIGRPVHVERGGRRERTAIDRKPVADRRELDVLGFDGDEVGDTKHHGGRDKAVCCYPSEHYPHFERLLARPLAIPAFGENLTLEGMAETELCIGDSLCVGSAVVQISQPRQPCGTLAAKHEEADLPRWINDAGFTGFYLRVLEPGGVAAGDTVELIERPHAEMTVARANRIMRGRETGEGAMRRLADLPLLAESWRTQLAGKLARGTAD